jgi:hypothetical protein
MPISSEAIERFLSHSAKLPWDVKGKPIDELISRVERLSNATYKPKTTPRPHQLEATAFALEVPHCLVFMKMRLGKTKTLLDWAAQLRAGGRWEKGKGLIITPRPIVTDVWDDEIRKHSEFKFRLVRNDLSDFLEALASDCDLIVTAMTGLQRMLCQVKRDEKKGVGHRRVDYKLVKDIAQEISLAGVDEIHKCGNPSTVNFKVVAALTENCRFFMGLTGTPAGRDPFKVWGQAFLADRGETLGNSYYFFEQAFGKKRESPFSWSGFETVFDPARMPALDRKLDQIAISYGWDGYIDMPQVQYNVVNLKMSPEQSRLYQEVIDKIIQSKKQDETLEASFVRLRQISSGFLPFVNDNGEERVQFIKDASKLAWIEEFLDEAPRETKIIICHDFTLSGQMLCDHLKTIKVPHLWMYGGTKDKTKMVREFQTSKRTNVLVANSAVMELGINLDACDYMCFYESPVSPTIRQQAEARPMSPERKDRPINVDDLVCSAVERKILGFIREGKTLLANLIYDEAVAGML